jgi:HD-GYP domain-containing protein (c-di-GMP phosphodiesterase class II)
MKNGPVSENGFQAALSEARASTTQAGLALWAAQPERFAQLNGQRLASYLPALGQDLLTPAFERLLGLTRQTFGEPAALLEGESRELARFAFWQTLQRASAQLDWTHPQRAARTAALMAAELGWTPAEQLELYWGTLFHDVGKVFIEDLEARLDAQGCPGSTVLAFVRTHAAFGGLFMRTVTELFPLGAQCAGGHQESVDGSGYPAGLGYAQNPKAAILANLADGYDACVTRAGWSAQRVCQEEEAFFARAGLAGAPELGAFVKVVQRYHDSWYPVHPAG